MKRTIEFQKPSDLKEWVYHTIKKLILDSEYEAGEKLHIESLSAQMGISRTPIREALLRLQNEGFVRAEPRVGFFVQELTRRDLEELFELRELIEGYAARRAARKITDRDSERVQALQAESERAVARGELDVFLRLEIELHDLVIERSENRRLAQLLEGIKELTARARQISVQSPDNVRQSVAEHRLLVDALSERDARLAEKSMKDHLRAVRRRLLARVAASEDD
jgi:DNA-binding GntR family transcriptional regulator